MTTAEQTEAADTTDLLSDVSGDLADLYRIDSTLGVRVIFLPDMDHPESAHIVISDGGGKALDQLDIIADPSLMAGTADEKKLALALFTKEVMDIYHHPTFHSKKAADRVAGRTPAA